MIPVRVNASVTSEDPQIVARVLETFSRACAGLALEGVTVFLMACPDEEAPVA